jgi:electron transfer flavoprotein alpha subunit
MANGILVVAEQRRGSLNKLSWETLVGAQQLSAAMGQKLCVAVMGKGVGALAEDFASKKLDEVWLIEHDLLADYTPDGYSLALQQVLKQMTPYLVLMPHTYQVREFLPKLATSLGRGVIGDCIAFRKDGDKLIFVRLMFQGKTNADVTFAGDPPYFATFQAGSFRTDQLATRTAKAPIKSISVSLDASQIRTKPLEFFQEAKQAVDLSQANVIVAVGRGIKAAENIPLARKLAELLGGEVAASRPICDDGWLPLERQIGSSGQTVAPKLYLALGISGAIQHVVGMKGSRTVVAINRDPNAPIFEVADYGIVGDLFEIVPPLIEEIQKAKA